MVRRMPTPAETRVPLPAETFSEARHGRFLSLSGDVNPLHADVDGARRLYFGQRVVHGMHLTLWALDTLAAADPLMAPPATLEARFERPVFVGERVTLTYTRSELTLSIGTLRVTTIRFTPGTPVDGVAAPAAGARPESPPADAPTPAAGARPESAPDRAIDSLVDATGTFDTFVDPDTAAALFPGLWATLGPDAAQTLVGRLCALSRVVGMDCPGRRALFSSARLAGLDAGGRGVGTYTVERVRPHLSMVDLSVAEPDGGLSGVLRTFVIPPAPPFERHDLAHAVAPGRYAHVRALVIGGSRGLGAISARILAAGGASVRLTYRTGRAEADAVVDACGAGAGALPYDVDHAAEPQLETLGHGPGAWSPTHVLYFATPRIFGRRADPFDAERFEGFVRCYVQDFARLVEALVGRYGDTLAFFNPSSTALDSPVLELTEYAAAKAAAEQLSVQLARRYPRARFVSDRLPRIETDQTISLVDVPAADAVQVLLGVLAHLVDSSPPTPPAGAPTP